MAAFFALNSAWKSILSTEVLELLTIRNKTFKSLNFEGCSAWVKKI